MGHQLILFGIFHEDSSFRGFRLRPHFLFDSDLADGNSLELTISVATRGVLLVRLFGQAKKRTPP